MFSKAVFVLFVIVVTHHLPIHASSEPATCTIEQVQELDKSIAMLKKWQKQYLNKKRRYESRRRRVLFRDSSPKDAQAADRLALDAQSNVQEIQAQIDRLQERKNSLLQSEL